MPGTRSPKHPRLPRIVRYLGVHCAIGVIVGCLFATLLIVMNIAGLKELLTSSEQPLLPALMLYVSCALTFASLVMGAAVMTMDEESEGE